MNPRIITDEEFTQMQARVKGGDVGPGKGGVSHASTSKRELRSQVGNLAPSPPFLLTLADTISFHVRGVPQPKGSTKAFFRPGMKYPVITNDNTKTKPWAEGVKLVAQQYAPAGGPWDGAVELFVWFYLIRPKSLPKKILDHVKKPDLDKLLRALKDSLKGVIYFDDSQVVRVEAQKKYATEVSAPGVHVIAKRYRETTKE